MFSIEEEKQMRRVSTKPEKVAPMSPNKDGGSKASASSAFEDDSDQEKEPTE